MKTFFPILFLIPSLLLADSVTWRPTTGGTQPSLLTIQALDAVELRPMFSTNLTAANESIFTFTGSEDGLTRSVTGTVAAASTGVLSFFWDPVSYGTQRDYTYSISCKTGPGGTLLASTSGKIQFAVDLTLDWQRIRNHNDTNAPFATKGLLSSSIATNLATMAASLYEARTNLEATIALTSAVDRAYTLLGDTTIRAELASTGTAVKAMAYAYTDSAVGTEAGDRASGDLALAGVDTAIRSELSSTSSADRAYALGCIAGTAAVIRAEISATSTADRIYANGLTNGYVKMTEVAPLTNGFLKAADLPADNLAWTNKVDTATLGGYVQTNNPALTDSRTPLAHSQDLASITDFVASAYASSNQGARADSAMQTNYDGIVTLANTNSTSLGGLYLKPPAVASISSQRIGFGVGLVVSNAWLGANDALLLDTPYFYRYYGSDDASGFLIYDAGNFAAGVDYQPAGTYLVPSDTNSLPYGISSATSTSIALSVVAPWTNQVTASSVAAAGGVTNISVNGTTGTVSGGIASVTIAAGGGSGVWTNWLDAMSIGVGLETTFPTYQIRTNANGSMPVLAFDKTVAGAWAGPFVIVPASSNIVTFWQGYHSTTGTTAVASRWRVGLNAWSAVTTSGLQNAMGSLTSLDTLTNAVSGLTALEPTEFEITTISTNSGTSGGYHYLKAWGWTP